jgi:hypothetical protein
MQWPASRYVFDMSIYPSLEMSGSRAFLSKLSAKSLNLAAGRYIAAVFYMGAQGGNQLVTALAQTVFDRDFSAHYRRLFPGGSAVQARITGSSGSSCSRIDRPPGRLR